MRSDPDTDCQRACHIMERYHYVGNLAGWECIGIDSADDSYVRFNIRKEYSPRWETVRVDRDTMMVYWGNWSLFF